MEKFSSTISPFQTKTISTFLVIFVFLSFGLKAQDRNFGFVFSENLRGSTALFGNTLMNLVTAGGTPDITAMNGNSVDGNSIFDNGNFGLADMQYVDIDGNTGDGAGTRNSSSSDLVLPAGTNSIRVARLYWSGRAATSQFDMTQAVNQKIKIRKGTTGAYQEYNAAQINKYVTDAGLSTEYCHYQAYVDITNFVKQEGAGTYTVGNGAFSTGTIDNYGNYGAWSIVVVYENPALDFNSVRVYDGYQQIFAGNSVTASTVTLTGLNVPSGPLSLTDAKLGIIGFEGDSRYNGDFFQINNSRFSDGLNPIDNPWNGTNTINGTHVTTKNPNYTDQMGIDIDQADVGIGYGILPDATSVTLQLGTTQDQFFCGVISFVIKMKYPPVIALTKTVTDANNSNTAETGEVLTYKLKGKNISAANVNLVEVSDSLPSSVTFVANSLKVNYCPGIAVGSKTDVAGDDIAAFTNNTVNFKLGTGATSLIGGTMAAADSFEVEFNVTVNLPASGNVPPIINSARLFAQTDALINYVDDATIAINGSIVLPVTITSFTANLQTSNQVKVAWSTSQETNSRRFDIERSTDGVIYKTVETKAAAGNSSIQLFYSINDDVTSVTAPILYYRLKQIDIDGKSYLSKVVSIKLKKTVSDFIVSPNPYRNNVNINIEWDKNETTVIKVFNVAGAEVVAKSVKMIKGNNYITIDDLSKLQPGNYIIQFNTSNGKLIKQVIKQQ